MVVIKRAFLLSLLALAWHCVNSESKKGAVNHSFLGRDYHESAEKAFKAGDFVKAIADYKQALKHLQQIYLGDHLNIAAILANLGSAYDSTGDLQAALTHKLKALQMRQRYYKNEDNVLIAVSLNAVGLTYYKLGEFDSVIRFYDKSLKMLKRIHKDADNGDIATCFSK
jgi:tetratricopeptide (TPR) repeat protein